jgi:hypothetical protein
MHTIQHYFSIASSLILILLIIVPKIGGTPVSQTYGNDGRPAWHAPHYVLPRINYYVLPMIQVHSI